MVDPISSALCKHYSNTFAKYGSTPKGVDWGDNSSSSWLRQKIMAELFSSSASNHLGNLPTLLDVGCGYGALYDYIKSENIEVIYTGVDIVDDMILSASHRNPNASFVCADFFDPSFYGSFDYVVCNGIFTQKLASSILDMNIYCQKFIKKMYECSTKGIAFNAMSTFVNFQMDNLYYRNPSEFLAWCMSEITPRVRLNAAYDLWYEYTVYLYHPNSY